MEASQLILLIEVLDKLGLPTDAAGISTIFAHLAELEARLTVARGQKLDALDAAVSSRAAAADYTPGRAAKLDFLDALISSRASAADYTALRAGYLDLLGTGVVAGRSFTVGSATTNSNALQTSLGLNGKGTLHSVAWHNVSALAIEGAELKITVDGNVIFDAITTSSFSSTVVFVPTLLAVLGLSLSSVAVPGGSLPIGFNIDFKTSLLIQTKSDGVNNIKAAWAYNI